MLELIEIIISRRGWAELGGSGGLEVLWGKYVDKYCLVLAYM
jgi:hypothetical protein